VSQTQKQKTNVFVSNCTISIPLHSSDITSKFPIVVTASIVLETILRAEFVRMFDAIHRLVEPQAGALRFYILQNNYPNNRRLSPDRVVPEITSQPVLGVGYISGVTVSDMMFISVPVTHRLLVQKLKWATRKSTSYNESN